jgi:hypothetical protein
MIQKARNDNERIMRKRFKEFSLSLNPDKTRLIEFGRFAAERRARRGHSGAHAIRATNHCLQLHHAEYLVS